MAGTILIPGFVDVHIHGCAGGDASDADKAGLEKMANELKARCNIILPDFNDLAAKKA